MASTATTTQINVRIDRSLKDAGDAALLDAGVTPSEAIRALWELAVRCKEAPGALRDLLFPKTAEEEDEAARRRAEAVACARAGRSIVADARRAAGIPTEAVLAVASIGDDELYGEALFERYGERWSL